MLAEECASVSQKLGESPPLATDHPGAPISGGPPVVGMKLSLSPTCIPISGGPPVVGKKMPEPPSVFPPGTSELPPGGEAAFCSAHAIKSARLQSPGPGSARLLGASASPVGISKPSSVALATKRRRSFIAGTYSCRTPRQGHFRQIVSDRRYAAAPAAVGSASLGEPPEL